MPLYLIFCLKHEYLNMLKMSELCKPPPFKNKNLVKINGKEKNNCSEKRLKILGLLNNLLICVNTAGSNVVSHKPRPLQGGQLGTATFQLGYYRISPLDQILCCRLFTCHKQKRVLGY